MRKKSIAALAENRFPVPFSPIWSRSISSKLREPSGKNPCRALASGALGNAHSSSQAPPSACVAMYGKRVEPVFWAKLDLVDRNILCALALLLHASGVVDVGIWRPVKLGRVGFEGMRAELLDIGGDRRSQALRA